MFKPQSLDKLFTIQGNPQNTVTFLSWELLFLFLHSVNITPTLSSSHRINMLLVTQY